MAREAGTSDRARLEQRIADISARYDQLSATYQDGKADNDIPLN